MATTGVEDVEYESDPEEVKRSLAMRRHEASDDEEGEGDGGNRRTDRRSGNASDHSDGQGGVAEYDDDEEYIEDEDEEEDEEGYAEDEVEEVDEIGQNLCKGRDDDDKNRAEGLVLPRKESNSNLRSNIDESVEGYSEDGQDEEKKENEPFAVPTAGSFYMHDDRFGDNAGGRHRRIRDGRKLWESKGDRKWGHDKFEEINLQGRRYKERRETSRGRYGGRGRGAKGAYPGGSRTGYTSSSNQSQAPMVLRGRGFRRYEPAGKINGKAAKTQNKHGKPLEKTPHANSNGSVMNVSNVESEPVPPQKQVVTSILNSASPPFYPSGSPNKDIQAGCISRNFHHNSTDGSVSIPQTNALLRGKNVVGSVGTDNIYADNSAITAIGKSLNNLQLLSSGSSGAPHPRVAGKGVPTTRHTSYQPVPPQTEGIIMSSARSHAIQRSSMQGQSHNQPIGQQTVNLSQSSSPPRASVGLNSFESGEVDTVSESSKSKIAIVGKGRGNPHGTGRGSFIYGGAQVMGSANNLDVSHGDQNFPATPAFLPVVQFGGQHPGGIPAVGMAFPGFVAQRQLGSEMTWLPLLAGAAGAVGTSYRSPYLALDDAYRQQSGQTSSASTSRKENSTNTSNNEINSSKGPGKEITSEGVGQRHNKPRRYSEMNFGQ